MGEGVVEVEDFVGGEWALEDGEESEVAGEAFVGGHGGVRETVPESHGALGDGEVCGVVGGGKNGT